MTFRNIMPQGDSETAEQLIERVFAAHGRRLYGIAFRITGSRAEAEDVVQDVFVGLPRALASFRGDGTFEGWLTRVTVRVALMHVRSTTRRAESDLLGADEVAVSGDPLDAIAYMDALRALPVEHRTVFVLHEVEGFSHDEIGQLLNISHGASAVRLLRARRALRTYLGDA